MGRLADIEAFTAVVASGSFSAAAERLGITKSVVSRRINRLESHLGTRLIRRTTRRLSLTEAGRHFYERAVRILADLEEAEQSVTRESSALRGTIRLAAPLSFGLYHLSQALAEFLERHPAIELDLDLNDRHVNLVEEGFDLALRIGDLEDSSLVARRLGTIRHATCASPDYLRRHGEPRHPEELAQHIGLQYAHVTPRRLWRFVAPDGRIVVARPHIRIRSNNGDALAQAAAAGLGITTAPTFILSRYVQAGALVPILRDYLHPETGIHAVYPPGRLAPRRVRALADHLAARFGNEPYWDAFLL